MRTLLFSSACGSVFVAALLLGIPSFAAAADGDAAGQAQASGGDAAGQTQASGERRPGSVAPSTTLDDLLVVAHTNQTSMAGGGMIAVQETPVVRTTIGQGFIDKQNPIETNLESIRLAPGVNVAQDNPLGLSERSELSVRGLDQAQMGFVVEHYPANDPGTDSPDDQSWASNENVKAVTITQGTSELSSPVIEASGGLVEVLLRDPSHTMGGTLSVTGGSFAAKRGFVRYDTGDIGSSGVRAYISYSDASGDNWRGPGSADVKHVDMKLVKDWSDTARTSLLLQYHQQYDQRETIPTLAQFTTPGLNYNSSPTYTFGNTNYYGFTAYGTDFYTLASTTDVEINPNLSVHVTPYYRYLYYYSWGATVLPDNSVFDGTQNFTSVNNLPYSQDGKFTAKTVFQTGSNIEGVNAYANIIAGRNTITTGLWYEHDDVFYTQQLQGVDQAGTTIPGFLKVGSGVNIAGINYDFNRDIVAIYAGDEISLADGRLKLLFGIKDLGESLTGTNKLIGITPTVRVYINSATPRAGFTYKFGEHSQIFADLVTNVRPPPGDTTYFDQTSNATGARTFVGNQHQPAEYSFQQEAGYRYQSVVNFSAAAFHNVLYNHQVNSFAIINGGIGTTTIPAGTEEIYGMQAEFGLRPWHNISPYLSAQYLHAETETNLPVGNDLLPTSGKIAPRAPSSMASGGLTYDDGSLFASITGKYVGSQYSTFMDNQKMPSYSQFDATLGYRFPNLAFAKRPTIQVNLLNLADKPYLGVVASPTATAVATRGINGTTINASQPGYYTAAGFATMVTFKADF
jgi:iron complex outermembrane recepter protein